MKLLADEKSILHEWLTKQTKVGGKGGQTGHPLNNMYSLESYLIRPIQVRQFDFSDFSSF